MFCVGLGRSRGDSLGITSGVLMLLSSEDRRVQLPLKLGIQEKSGI